MGSMGSAKGSDGSLDVTSSVASASPAACEDPPLPTAPSAGSRGMNLAAKSASKPGQQASVRSPDEGHHGPTSTLDLNDASDEDASAAWGGDDELWDDFDKTPQNTGKPEPQQMTGAGSAGAAAKSRPKAEPKAVPQKASSVKKDSSASMASKED